MVEPEVKGDEHLQVVDHHRARDESLIEEQSLDVLGEQIHLPHAQRREALAAHFESGVSSLTLVEVQERLRLDVNRRGRVVLVRVNVVAVEEEVIEGVTGDLASPTSRAVEHLVEVLRCAVVARMPCVAEPVREAVKRARRGHGLVRPTSVHDVEQVGLDPSLDDIAVVAEPDEPLRVVEIFATKSRPTARASAEADGSRSRRSATARRAW